MPTYITLIHFTERGVKSFRDIGARLDASRKLMEGMGASMKAYYLTMGRCDAVAVLEVPDDETAAKVALVIAGQGNVRTETLRAFTEDEAKRLASELP